MGRESRKEGIFVFVWPIHFAAQQTQQCEATILQWENDKNKNEEVASTSVCYFHDGIHTHNLAVDSSSVRLPSDHKFLQPPSSLNTTTQREAPEVQWEQKTLRWNSSLSIMGGSRNPAQEARRTWDPEEIKPPSHLTERHLFRLKLCCALSPSQPLPVTLCPSLKRNQDESARFVLPTSVGWHGKHEHMSHTCKEQPLVYSLACILWDTITEGD